jgi:hypothetical protein
MRTISILILLTVSSFSWANTDYLIDKIRKNNITAAREYLVFHAQQGHPYPLNVVRDALGVRPILYAHTPEMTELLMEHDAVHPKTRLAMLHAALKRSDHERARTYLTLEDLIEAIKADNVEVVSLYLAFNEERSGMFFDINQENADGQTPIFFAHSPQMLLLLLRNDARLGHHDSLGNNLLHHLLAVTAPQLTGLHLENEAEIRRQIEETALLMVRVGTTVLGENVLLLDQGQNTLYPVNYIEDEPWNWTPGFIERLRNAHQREYAAPIEGGEAGRDQRRREIIARERLAHMLAQRREYDAIQERREQQRAERDRLFHEGAVVLNEHVPAPVEQAQPVVVLTPTPVRADGEVTATHYYGVLRSMPQFALDRINSNN